MRERGVSLVEVLIAAAIVAIMVAAVLNMTAASHPLGARSAISQFDTALAYARSVAATSGNGATIVLTQSTIGVYSGRPTASGAMHPAPIAPLPIDGASISEVALGAAPLALFVNSAGHVTMASFAGATPPPLASEPACPSSLQWVLKISDSRSTATRTFPCEVISAGASVVQSTVAPEPSELPSSGPSTAKAPAATPAPIPAPAQTPTPAATQTPAPPAATPASIPTAVTPALTIIASGTVSANVQTRTWVCGRRLCSSIAHNEGGAYINVPVAPISANSRIVLSAGAASFTSFCGSPMSGPYSGTVTLTSGQLSVQTWPSGTRYSGGTGFSTSAASGTSSEYSNGSAPAGAWTLVLPAPATGCPGNYAVSVPYTVYQQ